MRPPSKGNSTIGGREVPITVPVGRPGAPRAFGATTERFFAEGVEREASGWPGEPWAEETSKRGAKAGNFESIPRQRGATVALAVFAACLAFGLVIGIKALVAAGRKVDASASIFSRSAGRGEPSAPVQTADAGVAAPGMIPQPGSSPTSPPTLRIENRQRLEDPGPGATE